MAATGTPAARNDTRSDSLSEARNGEASALVMQLGPDPGEQRISHRGEASAHDDALGPRGDHEQLHRQRNPPDQGLSGRLGELVPACGSAEHVPAVGGRFRPQALQSRSGRERLEAAGLAACTDDVASDGDVTDLSGGAIDAAHDLPGMHDGGGEAGTEVEIGQGSIGAETAQVVRAETPRP